MSWYERMSKAGWAGMLSAVVVGAIVLAACVPGRGAPADGATPASPSSTTPDDEAAIGSSTVAPGAQLIVDVVDNPVPCDGTPQPAIKLLGALPAEQIDFTSPDRRDILSGVVDDDGEFTLRWSCQASEIGTSWEIEALARTSNRTATFTIDSTEPDPDDDDDNDTDEDEDGTADADGELTVDFIEKPFVCDAEARPLATLSGFEPGEAVGFTSPETDNLREGRADDRGDLTMRWQCTADDIGQTWNVDAIGQDSGFTTTVTFTGAAPDAEDEPEVPDAEVPDVDPTIELTENPFVCDGQTRTFGVISNLAAGESVEFTSPQSSNLRDGTADADGTLPVRWQCGSGDVGTTWEITATGETSQRPITFSLTGIAPADDQT